MSEDLLTPAEQYRLIRFQLCNWGTLSGIVDIPIAEKGHLFAGRSGSGKSTLLDAMSVLLYPRADFNAAAREARRSDRNFVSYIRGAWSAGADDADGSKVVSRYLRSGSTWSGIALTYRSTAGRKVTLLFVGFLRGNSSTESDVSKHFYVIPTDFALESIKDFGSTDYDVRLIKKRESTARHYTAFAAYSEDFRTCFDIREDNVLKLLHKAQSAKNMGDVDKFFRTFMLDTPSTYDAAAVLVEQFTNLKEAHNEVLAARKKVEILTAAREAYDTYKAAEQRMTELEELNAGIPGWKAHTKCTYLARRIPVQEKKVEQCRAELAELETRRDRLQEEVTSLQAELKAAGGGLLEGLEHDQANCRVQIKQTTERVGVAKRYLNLLQQSLPERETEWIELTDDLKTRREEGNARLTEIEKLNDELVVEKNDLNKKIARLDADIRVMEEHPTNIEPRMVELRRLLCEELALEEDDLPFAGELIQIKKKEKPWQGAAERVVHQFALSLLVSDEIYPALSRYVNDHHLGQRLVYLRAGREVRQVKVPGRDSLALKFDLKEGPFKEFIQNELASRFNYECVQSVELFADFEKAMTMEGQVKHNRSRHEKDDRHQVDDPRFWVTGFDNRAKLKLARQDRKAAASEADAKEKELKGLRTERNNISNTLTAVGHLLDLRWQDINLADLQARLHDIQNQIAEIREKNKDFRRLESLHRAKDDELKKVGKAVGEANGALRMAVSALEENQGQAEDSRKDLEDSGTSAEVINRITTAAAHLTLKTDPKTPAEVADAESQAFNRTLGEIDKKGNEIAGCFTSERNKKEKEKEEAANRTVTGFSAYIHEWQAEAADLQPTLESAKGFFNILAELIRDGLPQYEKKFRDLLGKQGRNNLANLYKRIEDEKDLIKKRIGEVNTSLEDAVFGHTQDGSDTHLEIVLRTINIDELKQFKQVQTKMMSIDLISGDLKAYENYFALLDKMVTRFDPNNKDDQEWRDRVLDVRQQVSFICRELSADGDVIDTISSAAGKSGGQKQKLTMTCLVAALRYQLGGSHVQVPKYSTLVMDEAFDKADSEFTDLSMKIIERFHFQPILATPEKGIPIFEPYLGSFSHVSCTDRRHTRITSVPIEKIRSAAGTWEEEQSDAQP